MSVGPRRLAELAVALAVVALVGCDEPTERASTEEPTSVERVSTALPSERRPTLAKDAARADVAVLREALVSVHPGYDRYADAKSLNARWAALDAMVAGEGDVDAIAFYLEISRLLAAIRCEHTVAELPPSIAELRRSRPSFLPFRFRIIDGRVWVVSVDPAQPKLLDGVELMAIDGRPVAEIIEEIAPMVAVDGLTEHAVAAKLALDDDLVGSALDHFLPLLDGFRTSHVVHVREVPSGLTTRLLVENLDAEVWRALPEPLPGGPRERAKTFADAVEVSQPQAGTTVLTIDTFVNDRRPKPPEEVYGPIFRDLAEGKVEHLVLDLRANDDGSDDAAIGLLRHLIAEPFTFMKPHRVARVDFGELREHLESRDSTIFQRDPAGVKAVDGGGFELIAKPEGPKDPTVTEQTPATPSFEGRVTVLTSSLNASGATNFLSVLIDRRPDVRLVGEPTGGSGEGPTAGVLMTLTLPNSGIKVRIPSQRETVDVRGTDHRRVKNGGIIPDIVVSETVQDFREGRDAAMAAALGADAVAEPDAEGIEKEHAPSRLFDRR